MAGPQCCSNPPIINTRSGSDSAENMEALMSMSQALLTPSVLFFLSLIFLGRCESNTVMNNLRYNYSTWRAGYGAPNLRKLAGRVAASGFCVVVPDFFHGDPFVYDNNRPLAIWLNDHGTDKAFEEAKSVIDALIGKGFSAIGAAGFCWGAKVVTELAKSEFIQAAVLLHPSFTTVDDIEGVKSPIAILGAEIDDYSPPELVKKFEDILNAKPEVDSYVKLFPKVAHGWVLRHDADDEEAAKSSEEAQNLMLQWFVKHVK